MLGTGVSTHIREAGPETHILGSEAGAPSTPQVSLGFKGVGRVLGEKSNNNTGSRNIPDSEGIWRMAGLWARKALEVNKRKPEGQRTRRGSAEAGLGTREWWR